MTAPTLVKRRLTINFQRSVKAGKPQVMEVVVAPLTSPSAPNNDATMVGGPQQQDILLGNERNPAYFDLVPTDAPGLTDRLTYRVAWREKYMGAQFTKDFVMPDFDCDYDDLELLGNIIGGETYLQWTDRMRPGGVAALNEQGQVVDSEGNPITGAESAAVVQGNLDAEVVARMQGDQFLRTYFLQFAEQQITQVYNTTAQNLAFQVNQLQNADLIEKTARVNGDKAIQDALEIMENDLQVEIQAVDAAIGDINDELVFKADLVNGKIPSDQIPSVAIGNAVTAANEAEMLALTSAEVQPGDLCVRPDGTFMLNQNPPSVAGNWVKLSDAAAVSSVNGQTGTVVLSAANVGARPATQPIPQSDITGLLNSLNAKTDTSVTAGIHQRLTTVETDPTTVHTAGGVIAHSVHGNDVAFLNVDGQIVNKSGQVMNIGGAGGILDIADVTGLQLALDGKVDKTDPALTNARPPTPHAANHAAGSSDPLTPAQIGARALADPVPPADVAGLAAILANNNLTSTSNHGNRINALESAGPGSGGGTAPVKSAWFDNPSTITGVPDVADLSAFAGVLLKSPFGKNASTGQLYYNPAGANEGEAVYPYISPAGHLNLVKRNETNPPDKPPASQDDLTALTSVVSTKASQVDLASTNNAVATKANQSALDSTNQAVALKASIIQLNALGDVVATKANQTALDGTNVTVATKASQTALDATNATVGTKANQSDLATAQGQIVGLQANKADLASGVVPLGQIPFIPTSRVTNLDSQLGAINNTLGLKANQSALDATNAAMNTKADLVNGLVPTAQLPALAYTTTVVVSSRTAMLALGPTQVQPGDVCVITQTVDQGSYILSGTDPSVFANWVMLSVPTGTAVTTVNGQTGTVVLDAAAVGARSSATPIPMTDVSGLNTALGNKADTSAMNTALAGKTSPADVDARISQSSNNKPAVGLVATSAIPTLSGQQSIDGVLAPLGTFVLVTAQPSSINNGLYQVSSTAWPRMAEMANGDLFLKGTLVVVTGGGVNHDTLWQETSASGTVGTSPNNWIKTLIAGAQTNYTASLGVKKVVNDFQAAVVAGGGLQVVAGGLQIDPAVGVRKTAVDVPSGSTIATITHNLGTTDVSATFRDKASGDLTLVGWKPTGLNTISVEFDSPIASGQWRCVVMG